MNKKLSLIYIAFITMCAGGLTVYAETAISDVPYEVSVSNEPETETAGDTKGGIEIVYDSNAPKADSAKSSSGSVTVPGSAGAGSTSQETASVTVSDAPTTEEYNAVGLNHSSDPSVSIDLGFQVVSPIHQYGEFKVAEGSVQLSDGSWAEIGYDKLIRGGYYKLLREATDTTGVQWYIVAVNASKIGNFFTPDGSHATELWLKKSDCSVSGSVSVNTSNATRQNIVKTALSLAGSRYTYGGNGPDAFDCSGFVKYVMAQNGISVPRTSTEICGAGAEVGIEGLRPGDIVGRPGHVGIYIGNGYFIHSSETSTGVIVESVAVYNKYNTFTCYRNVAGD